MVNIVGEKFSAVCVCQQPKLENSQEQTNSTYSFSVMSGVAGQNILGSELCMCQTLKISK